LNLRRRGTAALPCPNNAASSSVNLVNQPASLSGDSMQPQEYQIVGGGYRS